MNHDEDSEEVSNGVILRRIERQIAARITVQEQQRRELNDLVSRLDVLMRYAVVVMVVLVAVGIVSIAADLVDFYLALNSGR